MPNYLYLERIALLNEVIGSIRNLRDNNPKTRTILVSIFAILSMLLLLLKLSTDELGIWFLMFTVIGGTVAWTFVRTFVRPEKFHWNISNYCCRSMIERYKIA
ncbi:hypothetical protein BDR26DRAFT_858255 [Obelidium mucronatum]|nr:hypothetical protein BDR26DRAFT_858255 [Obelidium mucronatum]